MGTMINTPYGPVLEADEAWDIVIGRLRPLGLEYLLHNDVITRMSDIVQDDPEMHHFVITCSDADFDEWVEQVTDDIVCEQERRAGA